MYKILLLLAMIFLHIVDDYYLQGWLASAKQKSYWEHNAPDKLYKHDYIMALFMHSFSWTFMIMLVPTLYLLIVASNANAVALVTAIFFLINLALHMITDDMKANEKKINLIQDQSIHLAQIVITWIFFVIIFV